jgi:hypothetical protein
LVRSPAATLLLPLLLLAALMETLAVDMARLAGWTLRRATDLQRRQAGRWSGTARWLLDFML